MLGFFFKKNQPRGSPPPAAAARTAPAGRGSTSSQKSFGKASDGEGELHDASTPTTTVGCPTPQSTKPVVNILDAVNNDLTPVRPRKVSGIRFEEEGEGTPKATRSPRDDDDGSEAPSVRNSTKSKTSPAMPPPVEALPAEASETAAPTADEANEEISLGGETPLELEDAKTVEKEEEGTRIFVPVAPPQPGTASRLAVSPHGTPLPGFGIGGGAEGEVRRAIQLRKLKTSKDEIQFEN
eukprot:Polyplicarium_translucidae@DN1847_c1_g1_i2.p1